MVVLEIFDNNELLQRHIFGDTITIELEIEEDKINNVVCKIRNVLRKAFAALVGAHGRFVSPHFTVKSWI